MVCEAFHIKIEKAIFCIIIDLHGFKCMNCSSSSEGFLPNGDDLKISFWATTADTISPEHSGMTTFLMICCYPPASEVSREVVNLTERKSHIPMNMVSKNLSVCLL